MFHHHTTHLPAAFFVDGISHPVVSMDPDPSWPPLAEAKGFRFIARVTDRYRCLLRCHACGTNVVVRVNVVRDHQPLCRVCIHRRRAAAAQRLGAELIAADGQHRHYGQFRLACGHVVRRQYLRVEAAAAGGHAIDCETCRETRYGAEARAFGWTLAGPPKGRRQGYRRYRHRCGHHQDISIGNMAWGDASCGACAQTWAGRPSFIYLFRIDLPGLPVVKLGYSARPAKRLRHQLGLAREVRTEVLRVLLLPSGNAAVREESACHRAMRARYPDLIVPKAAFGDAINTQGEIYHAAALPVLHALLDGITRRRPDDGGAVEAPLPVLPVRRAPHNRRAVQAARDSTPMPAAALAGPVVTRSTRDITDARRNTGTRSRALRRS